MVHLEENHGNSFRTSLFSFSKLVSDIDFYSVTGHAQSLMTSLQLLLASGPTGHGFWILYPNCCSIWATLFQLKGFSENEEWIFVCTCNVENEKKRIKHRKSQTQFIRWQNFCQCFSSLNLNQSWSEAIVSDIILLISTLFFFFLWNSIPPYPFLG